MNAKSDKLNPVLLESIYKKIKEASSLTAIRLHYNELENARKQFESKIDSDAYDANTAKQLKKLFGTWDLKRKAFKNKLAATHGQDDNEVDSPVGHRTGPFAQKQIYAHQDWEDDVKIEEKDIIQEIKNEKLGVINKLNMIKDLQLKESELHSMHTEKLQGIDQLLGDSLKTQQQTNKELQNAYMNSTKTATTNMKTGMVATGGILGTLGLPVIGSIGGALLGWGIGKKVENTVVNKTEKNFEKLNKDV